MKTKSVFIIALALLSVFSLCSCTISVSSDSAVGSAIADAVSHVQGQKQTATANAVADSTLPQISQNTAQTQQSDTYAESTESQTEPSLTETTEIPTTKGFFTNEYGTPTTICAHRGCNMYIVSSGNSNCCRVHSATCKECGIYINEGETLCQHCAAVKSHI